MCDAVYVALAVEAAGGEVGRSAESNTFATLRGVQRDGIATVLKTMCAHHKDAWEKAVVMIDDRAARAAKTS
jgi:hypothetical protein